MQNGNPIPLITISNWQFLMVTQMGRWVADAADHDCDVLATDRFRSTLTSHDSLQNTEIIIFVNHMSSLPISFMPPAYCLAKYRCAGLNRRSCRQVRTSFEGIGRPRLKMPPTLVQRPVIKDFFLTKRQTADRKSQVLIPVFFTRERACIPLYSYESDRIGNEYGVFLN